MKSKFKAGDIVVCNTGMKIFVTGEGDKNIGYECFAGIVISENIDDKEHWPTGMFSDTWTLSVFSKVKGTKGQKALDAIFKKAAKWDALHEKVSEYYLEPGEEGYDANRDENGLLGIGEEAARAFGYL